MLIDSVINYFHQSKNAIFGDAITPQEGWSVGFLTRPVVGGHFSILALDQLQALHHRSLGLDSKSLDRGSFGLDRFRQSLDILLGFALVLGLGWLVFFFLGRLSSRHRSSSSRRSNSQVCLLDFRSPLHLHQVHDDLQSEEKDRLLET